MSNLNPCRLVVSFVALCACFHPAWASDEVYVTTQRYDNARTGQNLSEKILNTSNVHYSHGSRAVRDNRLLAKRSIKLVLGGEGLLDLEPIQDKWAEHQSGRRNWRYFLWNVLMFETRRREWSVA